MKLVRFGAPGREKPAVLSEDGVRLDVSHAVADYDRNFFSAGGLPELKKLLTVERGNLPNVAAGERWGAPVARPGKIICIGLNYSDHAAEAGLSVPEEPVLFMKAPNTTVGPFDDLIIPRQSKKTDWEVELGVIIGRDARYLERAEDAANHIAGYCISHDVSEREFQLERCGQWTKGKSSDTFNPLGPFLATPDELGDVKGLTLELWVNGEQRQSGNTSKMVFDPYYLVYYVSQFMTLEAGDLITTGTPPGVGMGMKPPVYLKADDVVELAISGLGRQRQRCRNAD